MDDSLLDARPPSPGSIRAILEGAATAVERPAPPPAAGEAQLLPQPGDPYKAHARPSQAVEPTLHVMTKEGYFRGFAWASYDSVDLLPPEAPGGGPVLVIRFAGLMPAEIVLDGRNLGVLHAYLGQNRIAWVRELPAERDFKEVGATVINRIEIRPVEPVG